MTPLIPCSAANLSERALVNGSHNCGCGFCSGCGKTCSSLSVVVRSEEHTSELQSLRHLVCRLLLHPCSTPFPYTTLFRSFPLLRSRYRGCDAGGRSVRRS